MVVDFVNEQNHPPANIPVGDPHFLPIFNKNDRKSLTDLHEVAGSQVLLEYVFELKVPHTASPLNLDASPLDNLQIDGLGLFVLRKLFEVPEHLGDVLLINRIGEGLDPVLIRTCLLDLQNYLPQPVVLFCLQFNDLAMLLDLMNEGQEQVPLNSVVVQLSGVAVGGGDQDHAALPENVKHLLHNHRIGDVSDLELIQHEHSRLLGEVEGSFEERVGFLLLLELEILSVHLEHELVEVKEFLLLNGKSLIEKIHQLGLSCAGVPIDVKSLGDMFGEGGAHDLHFLSLFSSLFRFL